MGLRLQSRAAVERALAEYRRLGREAFLERYGFRPSRQYLLVDEGVDYDSKAIAGVAHGFDHPDEGPLPASAFSGGVRGAAGALRALGFEVTGDVTPRVLVARAVPAPRELASPGTAHLDLVLIGCVKLKLAHDAPAENLYVSPLFRKRRAYAERSGKPWFILSALHGLVSPEQLLAPYDLALAKQSVAYRRAWGTRVGEQLCATGLRLDGAVVEIHAGAPYVDSLRPHLVAAGAVVRAPLAGMSQGKHLAWYGRTSDGLDLLGDVSAARSPLGFPWDRTDLGVPGLYAWYVDDSGAATFSAALGFEVRPGLVYVGQTGATSALAGRTSQATLRSRIGGQHLRGNTASSTWRKTIFALLRTELALDDAPRAVALQRLTAWMQDHLALVVLPVADGAAVGPLERGALERFDPPLNLAEIAPTPVRQVLKRLRRDV